MCSNKYRCSHSWKLIRNRFIKQQFNILGSLLHILDHSAYTNLFTFGFAWNETAGNTDELAVHLNCSDCFLRYWLQTDFIPQFIFFNYPPNTIQYPSTPFKKNSRSENGRKNINRDFIKGGRGGVSLLGSDLTKNL